MKLHLMVPGLVLLPKLRLVSEQLLEDVEGKEWCFAVEEVVRPRLWLLLLD